MKCAWMVNAASGQSSSLTLQRLEFMQRELEAGKRDKDLLDYEHTNAYFLYSETRACAVKLKKVSSNPVRSRHFHYVPLAEPSRLRH